MWDRVTEERRKWDEMLDTQADLARSEDQIHPQAVARAVSDLTGPEATQPWEQRWVRPTGCKRSIAHVR